MYTHTHTFARSPQLAHHLAAAIDVLPLHSTARKDLLTDQRRCTHVHTHTHTHTHAPPQLAHHLAAAIEALPLHAKPQPPEGVPDTDPARM